MVDIVELQQGLAIEKEFKGRVLDNVHGFIYYTEAENKIMQTALFKRLQSIKQLSIVNWVFPGSEHTRYIHSLGVMYIADKIAVRLNLPYKERKIARMAGLLHDIGHYPLSHVCESPYKKGFAISMDKSYCLDKNSKVQADIDSLDDNPKSQYMDKSTGYHHEKIGANIVLYNHEIRTIIEEECGLDAPDIIADMIIGNTERKENTNPLLVQILHSELDADGIDYLMRDAVFSGTSFGTFELDQLIGCMEIGEFEGNQILCINPKGIAAADQYLINKFFSYSQVVFNKHISITEWMAEQIVDWMQKNNAYFPSRNELDIWVKDVDEKYIGFTDNFFWASLQKILDNPLRATEPEYIRCFCRQLLNHTELEYKDNSEVKVVSNSIDEIKTLITNSSTYDSLSNQDSQIALFCIRSMSKQTTKSEFEKTLETMKKYAQEHPDDTNAISEDDFPILRAKRFMECICVKDGDEIHLLCDDTRSLMRNLYNEKLAILRTYNCDMSEATIEV